MTAKRISVNRARLRAGLPALRVETPKGMRHHETVYVAGPSYVVQVKKCGRWFAYVLTEARVEGK